MDSQAKVIAAIKVEAIDSLALGTIVQGASAQILDTDPEAAHFHITGEPDRLLTFDVDYHPSVPSRIKNRKPIPG